MSFGYAIGDFVLLTQLAWDVVQNSRKACGAHDELTSEVTSLHIVLRRLEVEVSKPNSILTKSDDSLDRREELAQLSEDCKRVLKVLEGILKKYNALSEEKRSVMKLWKKVQFGNGEMLDLAELRIKIATSTSALTLFLNLLSVGSQGKVEMYMENQGDELREMKRSLNWITAEMQAKAPKAGEGSILTTYAGDDKSIWKDFRRELIKEGFSSEVLQRHKETIREYVMELGSRGALDDLENDIGVKDLSLDGTADLNELESQRECDANLKNGSNMDQEVTSRSISERLSGLGSEGSRGQHLKGISQPKRVEDMENNGNELRLGTGVQNPDEELKLSHKEEAVSGIEINFLDDRHVSGKPTTPRLLSTDNVDPVLSKYTEIGGKAQGGGGSIKSTTMTVEGRAFETKMEPFRNSWGKPGQRVPKAMANVDLSVDASMPTFQTEEANSMESSEKSILPLRSHIIFDRRTSVAESTYELQHASPTTRGSNPRELIAEGAIQVYDQISDISRTTTGPNLPNTVHTISSARFSYSIASYAPAAERVRQWFGPHRRVPPNPAVALQFRVIMPLFFGGTTDDVGYRPHRLCHMILALARWYDQVKVSKSALPSSTNSPNMLSPIADEMYQLLGRACAYDTRNRLIGLPAETIFFTRDRFRYTLKLFYLFIRDGIKYVLACKEGNLDKKESDPADTLWVLDDDFCWQQGADKFILQRAVLNNLKNKYAVVQLNTLDPIEFLHGLFVPDPSVRSQFVTDSNTPAPVISFMEELQGCILNFKRSREKKFLQMESHPLWPGGPRLTYPQSVRPPVTRSEMSSAAVSEAAHEWASCEQALELWSFRNDYSRSKINISSFVMSENSLSTILQRCDVALEALFQARKRSYTFKKL